MRGCEAMAVEAYSTALFPAFYDAMVASLPREYEVTESHAFYAALAVGVRKSGGEEPVRVLDLCTGTGSVARSIAAAWGQEDGDGDARGAFLEIVGVDSSEEMLKAARAAWIGVAGVDAEWRLATLGQRCALAGVGAADLAIISAGSIHHLATRAEQRRALQEGRDALRVGGALVLNVFPLEEIVGALAPADLEVWRLRDGFWKQTLGKEVAATEDGGKTSTETFRIGREGWSDEGVCEWTLRAVPWGDVRALCAEVGLEIEREYHTFRDALARKSADPEPTGTTGRVFVARRRN